MLALALFRLLFDKRHFDPDSDHVVSLFLQPSNVSRFGVGLGAASLAVSVGFVPTAQCFWGSKKEEPKPGMQGCQKSFQVGICAAMNRCLHFLLSMSLDIPINPKTIRNHAKL